MLDINSRPGLTVTIYGQNSEIMSQTDVGVYYIEREISSRQGPIDPYAVYCKWREHNGDDFPKHSKFSRVQSVIW
jgi:hypothetical protein